MGLPPAVCAILPRAQCCYWAEQLSVRADGSGCDGDGTAHDIDCLACRHGDAHRLRRDQGGANVSQVRAREVRANQVNRLAKEAWQWRAC